MRARVSLALAATLLAISLPLFASAANVILNPGFETGTGNAATNWTGTTFKPNGAADNDAAFSVVSDAHTGARAAKIAITQYTAGDAKWVPDAVTVSAGEFYTLGFWYKSTTPTSAFIAYNGDFSCCWIGDLPAAADWTFFSTTQLVPAGKTSLQMYLALNSIGQLTTDDYSVESGAAPTFAQGLVSLTFDDGWQSFNDVAVPVMNAHGVKATAYIITGPEGSNIGSTPNGGYMPTATITALQTAGYEIGGHTAGHLDLVNQVTGAGQQYATPAAMWQGEIFDSRTDLTSAGFTPVTTFAYPYGQYNADVKAQVQSAGFTSARSVDQGFNFVTSDKFALKIMPINNQSTVAGINALIDQAISDKTWLVLMFHNVRTGTETQGSLNAACVEPVLDVNGNEMVPPQTQPDFDCTTSAVLDGIAAHLQAAPAGTTVTMGQGIAAMNASLHTITATSDANGTISPAGSLSVLNGATQSFALTPNAGFRLGSLLVDGVETATTSPNAYAFTNVTANHVISATFVALNAAPTATAQSVSTLKNAAVAVTLAGTDPENNTLTFATTSNPVNGVLSGTLPNLTYTPNAEYIGSDSFTFTVNDGEVSSAAATVTITVGDVPAPLISAQTSANVTQTSITITWTTDHAASSRVVWGTASVSDVDAAAAGTPNYGYTNSSVETDYPATVTNHSVTISGLTADTTYFFRAVSHGSPESMSPEVSVKTSAVPAPAPTGGSSGGGGGGNGPIAGSFGGGGSGSGFYFFGQNPAAPAATNGAPVGQVLGASTFKFLNDLKKGMTHGDVMELQKRMISEGVLTIDAPTSYFGAKTEAAVKAYQGKHSLPVVGRVGPMTRAVLNGPNISATGGTPVPVTNDADKASLVAKLQEQLKGLLAKIAALMPTNGSGNSAATTTPESMATSTPAVVATTTPEMIATSTAAMSTSTTATASSTQQ